MTDVVILSGARTAIGTFGGARAGTPPAALGAATAKRAYAQGRPILDVAIEMTGLPEARLRELLDPLALTQGGIRGGVGGGG